jgi:hypothetical protein
MPGAPGGAASGRAPIDLLAAYLDTDYRIDGDHGEVTLRIGGCTALPAPVRGRVHAVLSACNPRSRLLTPAENAHADAALRDRIETMGVSWRPARGVGRSGDWPPEPSLWLQDIAVDRLDQLALAFEQNACVVVGADRRIRLRVYRADWRDQLPGHPDLDWP